MAPPNGEDKQENKGWEKRKKKNAVTAVRFHCNFNATSSQSVTSKKAIFVFIVCVKLNPTSTEVMRQGGLIYKKYKGKKKQDASLVFHLFQLRPITTADDNGQIGTKR